MDSIDDGDDLFSYSVAMEMMHQQQEENAASTMTSYVEPVICIDELYDSSDLVVQELLKNEAFQMLSSGSVKAAVESAMKLTSKNESLKLLTSVLICYKDDSALFKKLLNIVSRVLRERNAEISGGDVVTFGRNNLQLGYVPTKEIQKLPKRVPFQNNKITSVACAEHHTLLLDVHGKVYAFGHSGRFGRLGLGDETSRVSPTLVASLKNVSQVACGRDHSMAVTKVGQMYCWGGSPIGSKTSMPNLRPRKVKLPLEDNNAATAVRQIATSATHALAISTSNELYAWGCNDKGQLMMNSPATRYEPRKVLRFDNVKQVAGSDGVTLLLNKNGYVYQGGHGSPSPFRVPITTTAASTSESEGWNYEKASVKIGFISCGPNHAAAISENGRLYTWGSYANLLGHVDKGCTRAPQQSHTTHPMCVDALNSHKVVAVSCAKEHTVAITSDGLLYSWGLGENGTLGTLGDSNCHETYQPIPRQVSTLRRVGAIAAGGAHTVAIVMPFRPSTSCRSSSNGTITVTTSSSAEDSSEEDEQVNIFNAPTLQSICELALARCVNTWNVFQTWLFARELYIGWLELYCQEFVVNNIDAVIANNPKQWEDMLSYFIGSLDDERQLVSPTKDPPQMEEEQVVVKEWEEDHQPAQNRDENLADLSVNRLRKRIDGLEAQLMGIEDSLVTLLVASPNCGSQRKSRKETQLEKQAEKLRSVLSTLTVELESRYEKKEDSSDKLRCVLCNVKVNNGEDMVYHVAGKRHRRNLARKQENGQAKEVVAAEEVKLTVGRKSSMKRMSQKSVPAPWSSSKPTCKASPIERRHSLSEIQEQEQKRKFNTPDHSPSLANSRKFGNSMSSSPVRLPGNASLLDYITPNATRQLSSRRAAWTSPSPVVDSSSILDFMRIQQDQEKEITVTSPDLTINSWGMCKTRSEETLADIQYQQQKEMESENLARQLAAMEKIEQSKLLNNKKVFKKKKKTKKNATTREDKKNAKRANNPQKEFRSKPKSSSRKKKPQAQAQAQNKSGETRTK